MKNILLIVAIVAGLQFAGPGPAYAGYFTNTGSLHRIRPSHTATLLPNGSVLVLGEGYAAYPMNTPAELFDPATGIWTTNSTSEVYRQYHSATLLTNGLVLVAAGEGWEPGPNALGPLTNAQLFNPITGMWTPTGSLQTGREDHTATLLPNGKVLVVGGNDDIFDMTNWFGYKSLSSAELYDPTSGTWTTSEMNSVRYAHMAQLLRNGKVLVAGGVDLSYNIYLSSAELYNPTDGTWTPTGDMNTNRARATATLLPDGRILVAGGYAGNVALASAELYDPVSETWTPTGDMNLARGTHAAALLPNGQVAVFGGTQNPGWPSSDVELYDPTTGTWNMTASMLIARKFHSATLLPDGRVLIVGGFIGANGWPNDYTASAELFIQAAPVVLTQGTKLPNGAFRFAFTNTPGANFSAVATTNLSQSLSNWTSLGNIIEISAGQFQFTDPQATTNAQRFYRVQAN